MLNTATQTSIFCTFLLLSLRCCCCKIILCSVGSYTKSGKRGTMKSIIIIILAGLLVACYAAEESSGNGIIDVIKKCKEDRDKCMSGLDPGDREGHIKCLYNQVMCHARGLYKCAGPCIAPFFTCVGMQWQRVQKCAEKFLICAIQKCHTERAI